MATQTPTTVNQFKYERWAIHNCEYVGYYIIGWKTKPTPAMQKFCDKITAHFSDRGFVLGCIRWRNFFDIHATSCTKSDISEVLEYVIRNLKHDFTVRRFTDYKKYSNRKKA
jgi:hypothetical protein